MVNKAMSELQIIESALERTAHRQRWQRAWRGFWQGLLAGTLLWLTALVLFKVFPLPPEIFPAAGAVALLAMVIGFAIGWWRRPSLIETARWVDDKNGFKERLSTALEISQSERAGRWRDLLVADAAQCVAHINPRQLLPIHLPKAARWSLVALILSVGLGFVPEYRSKDYLKRQQEAEVIRDTGKTLAELTRRNLETRRPVLEPTRKALENVAEFGDQLAKASVTRSEALKDLASMTEKIKEQARELGKNPAFKAMDRAIRSPNKGGSPGAAELQKQLESLEKSMGNQRADPDALEQLQKDLEKARQAAAGLADKDAGAAEAAKQQLEQMLQNLAQRANEMGLSLPNLEEAIQALADSQIDQLVKDLKHAEMDLEKLAATAKKLAELQKLASQIGKDLAEQLQNGQADAAQSTLRQMAEQLNEANLSREQMEAILSEVSKAINPAGNYGKVAELLKSATGQMQNGQKAEAAQSLAQAADELDNLMQQLGDAQSLMASIEALQKAQMCIGNGQSWTASNVPRPGQGGGVGAGVGTWADDSRMMTIDDIKDRWDNSGVVRPDEAERGLTDRGEGQLPDSLAPTKVRGQLNPGAPMPSITLKGVSIKGMSKVDLSEVQRAAQDEAQAALSQEQVPRAYQGAVRDYFDDLKE
jgi:chromosome segregation ATPase